MHAVVLSGPGAFSVEQVPDPAPGPTDVVVEPHACGVCGTDLHLIDGALPDALYPIIPGHEVAGRVVAVGRDVVGLQEGDRVAVEPKVFCGDCHFCRVGRSNLCERGRSVGVIGIDGGFAELLAIPAGKAFRLPDEVPLDWGPLVEPVACAVHGFDLLDLRIADHVLIYGAGAIGLTLAQIARAHAAGSVSVVDLDEDRLARARALGADCTATSAEELDRPQGWEVVIDATGAVAAIEDGLTRVRKGGTFLLFGVAPDTATARFSPFRAYHEELRIIGSRAIVNSFARAGELLARRVVDADAMLTHRLPLHDFADAIDLFRRGEGVKIAVGAAA